MINNRLFKLPEIPRFHPVSQKYDRIIFWKKQVKKCIEGEWVSGKWMPPELYFYINFYYIVMEEGVHRGLGLPWCRDIDWEKAYIYSEATGFSGFELDEEYSCNRLLINELYTDEDLKKLPFINDDFYRNLFKSDGTRKKYIDARDYMKKMFPKCMGKPLYYNFAKNIIELTARGLGKSVWASCLLSHNFLFGGARDYDEYIIRKKAGVPLRSESVIGAIDTKYSYKLIDKIKDGLVNLPGKESLTIGGEKVIYPSPLSVSTEGSLSVGRIYKAIISGSQIQHVTFADNPLAANGGRPNKIFIDEVGFASSIYEIWEAIESTQSNETFKRLSIYGMGTGGLTSSGAITYLQDIFYNPEAYNCISIDDTWENTGKICCFISTLKSSNEFKEGENYITNEKRALASVMRERKKAERAKKKTKLLGLIINKPLKPSEIFLRMEGNFFDIQQLKKDLATLETNRVLLDSSWKVDLSINASGKVITRPSAKIPIRDFPLTKNVDLDACIEIFEKPKKDRNMKIFSNRYYAVVDPVDDDGNDSIKRSLQSCFIYDSWVDRLVAEYTARTRLVSEYYENVRLLCLYYNASLLYENNKKGLSSYFKNKNSSYLLMETPEILQERNLIKTIGIGNKSLGVNMNSNKMKMYAINMLKEWLSKPPYSQGIDPIMTNSGKIRSPALLKELIAYRIDLNADRVSALLVLMILIDDKKRIFEAMKKGEIKDEEKTDDFWKRAYLGKQRSNDYYAKILKSGF